MDSSTAGSWQAEAYAWIAANLARRGRQLTGGITVAHSRPWSTIWRVPVGNGELYFKAVSANVAFEAPLTVALAEWYPGQLPALLATDAARGWLLMEAEAPRLRELIRSSRDLRHWLRLLPAYAEMQIGLAARVSDLLALGVPDRRLETLPGRFAALLTDAEALRVGERDGLAPSDLQRLLGATGRVAELCGQAAGDGISPSLNHGDFHDGNIFLRGDGYVYLDWGDACISHPFFSFRTVCVSLEISLDLPENPPECAQLRDAYLEPWTRFASRERLSEAFETAYTLSILNGALTWQQALARLSVAERAESAHAVPALLAELMERLAGPG